MSSEYSSSGLKNVCRILSLESASASRHFEPRAEKRAARYAHDLAK